MKDADRKQAELIWEHLVRRLRELENKATAAIREASGPDHQPVKKPSSVEKPEIGDSDWDMQA